MKDLEGINEEVGFLEVLDISKNFEWAEGGVVRKVLEGLAEVRDYCGKLLEDLETVELKLL